MLIVLALTGKDLDYAENLLSPYGVVLSKEFGIIRLGKAKCVVKTLSIDMGRVGELCNIPEFVGVYGDAKISS